MRRGKFISIVCLLLLAISTLHIVITPLAYSLPSWPTPWIQIDTDPNENGPQDDWRDVHYAYFQFDTNYLYLKLECYDVPGKDWGGKKEGRYKWFIDLNGDMYLQGGNVYKAEYLLFVEDTDQNGVGEMYLLYDTNHDGLFSKYEPWPPANAANYKITDPNVGGWRIVSTYQIEMYISWASIGNPASYWLMWATDQQNPNLIQAPTTDHPDEEVRIAVHDVAAISQTPHPTIVTQGDHVTVDVVVQNQGTQTESFDVTCYSDSSIVGTLHVTNLAAGHSTTLYFDWDTTGVPAGTYNIEAWADSGCIITETDETDNWCYATATVTVTVHDVAAISQVPDQTSVPQGTIVNIDVTVQNLGGFTETFDVTCYYDSTAIGTKTVTNLAPSFTAHVFFAWDTTGLQGIYHIEALADSAYAITEANELNNVCHNPTDVSVYKPGSPGKLYVDKAETAVISGPDPPVVGQTTIYEQTITVTNTGDWDATNVKVEDTISGDVTFLSLGTPSKGSAAYVSPKITWTVGTITHGEIETLTFRVSLTPATTGLKYLNHKEDLSASGKTDSTSISDTGHNDVTVTAIVRDVTAFSQVPSKTVVNQGEMVSIHVTVENIGDVTESFDTTCYYDGTPIGVLRVNSLGSHVSTVLTFPWDTTGITPGIYSIRAVADSSSEIPESDETNNECHDHVTVEIVIHDIAATSQTPSPTTVQVGGTITIQVGVENQGTEPETFDVKCFYDSSQIGTQQQVINLQPSTSTTVTFTWDTTGVAIGTYYISATALPVSGETDTNDNTCTSTAKVTIYAPPSAGNLMVDKAKTAVISGPCPPVVGKTTVYELTITITNIGGSDVTSVLVQDIISSDVTYTSVGTPSQGSIMGVPPPIVWNVGTLAPGASATLTFRVSLTPATTGLKYLNHKEDLSASGYTQSHIVTDKGDTDVTVTASAALIPPVGGEWIPINKFALLTPWISWAFVTMLITTSFVYVRRKKQTN